MKKAPASTTNKSSDSVSQAINPTSDASRTQPTNSEFGDIAIAKTDDLMVFSTRKNLNDIDPITQKAFSDGHDGTIFDFLSRPFPLVAGVLAVTDDASTFGIIDVASALVGNSALTEKIQGKFLVKFDIKLTLVINADKFQQGRYILAAVPIGGATTNVTEFVRMHRHSKVQITQLPHIQMDINNDSQGELILPWVGPMLGYPGSCWNNANAFGSPWRIFLYPYSPLVTVAGSTTASYTLFVSLTNVTLGFPSISQMGTRVARDPIGSEQQALGIGKFGRTLAKISTASGILSEIPLLSTLSAPVSWVTNIFAKAVNVFGWSKPTNLKGHKLIKNQPFAHMTNADGVDTSQPLSLMVDNIVGVCPGFARTDNDEMSIDYIKAIPAYMGTATWVTTDAYDHVVLSIPISPTSYTLVTTETVSLTNFAPVTWLMQFFAYWRGSMTYNIKVVKTGFHSGRLLVSFTPLLASGPINNPGVTAAKSNYIYREIIDLKEKFEFAITVPYVHVNPWKNKNHGTIGSLIFTVLDPLIAPATVSDTVTLLYEISGGPDFEVSVPISEFNMTPVVPYTYQMQTSGDINSNANPAVIGQSVIGGASIGTKEIWNVENCIGESIKSLRSLAKRYSYLAVNEDVLGITQIRPFSFSIGHNISAISHHIPVGRIDALTHFSLPYLFSRGGVRIKTLLHTGTSRSRSYLKIINGNMPTTTVVHTTAVAVNRVADTNLTNLVEHAEALTGVCDVQVPQYHVSYTRNMVAEICAHNFTENATALEIVSPIMLYHVCDGNISNGEHTYRAAADDYNLGYFISIPPYEVYDPVPE